MKPLIYLSATLIWTAFSCGGNDTATEKETVKLKKETMSADDYKIINSTFYYLLTRLPNSSDGFGYDNHKVKNKSLYKEYFKDIYFTNVLVPINDSVAFNIKPDVENDIEDSSVLQLFKRNFVNAQNELKIEMDSITNIGLYNLIPLAKGQDVKRKIGDKLITYSRFIYNTEKTKALFYFENRGGGLGGSGQYVLVEKLNGIWTITNEYLTWIS